MFEATITTKGFEETISKETVSDIHSEINKILQQLNIDFMPHQLGKVRKLQIHYKSINKGDYKYIVAGKSIIKLSK